MCKEQKILRKMAKTMTWNEIGRKLDVSGALAWKVAKGHCQSRKVRAALGIRKEEVDRLAARVSVEQGAAIREYLQDKFGLDSITEFWLGFFMEEIMEQEGQ